VHISTLFLYSVSSDFQCNYRSLLPLQTYLEDMPIQGPSCVAMPGPFAGARLRSHLEVSIQHHTKKMANYANYANNQANVSNKQAKTAKTQSACDKRKCQLCTDHISWVVLVLSGLVACIHDVNCTQWQQSCLGRWDFQTSLHFHKNRRWSSILLPSALYENGGPTDSNGLSSSFLLKYMYMTVCQNVCSRFCW